MSFVLHIFFQLIGFAIDSSQVTLITKMKFYLLNFLSKCTVIIKYEKNCFKVLLPSFMSRHNVGFIQKKVVRT